MVDVILNFCKGNLWFVLLDNRDLKEACLEILSCFLPNASWACPVPYYLTTPYFMPSDTILTALNTAARGEVDFRVIIPYESDYWAAQYASDSYIEQCLESGVQMYRCTKGFVHAKTLLVDDVLSTIGNADFDYRSFALNFEINALI